VQSSTLCLHTFAVIHLLSDMLLYCSSPHACAVQAKEAKQQARRNKVLAKRQRAKAAAGAAKDQLRKFAGCKLSRSSSEKHGDVKLPDAVLQRVMSCLAAIEADGVRGPTMVANDLANAALVSIA
jgi:hypothetical protein